MGGGELFVVITGSDPLRYIAKELVRDYMDFAVIYRSALPEGFSVSEEITQDRGVTRTVTTLYKQSVPIAQLITEDYGFTVVYRVRIRKGYEEDIIRALTEVRKVVHEHFLEKLRTLRKSAQA